MMTTPLRAYHGSVAVKATYVARVKAHQLADEIVQGQYWKNGKGCLVGCAVHSNSHRAFEDEMGIPQHIARLADRIFEGLSNNEARIFPLAFFEAIREGADLSLVIPRFLVWLLVDGKHGVIRFAKTAREKDAIQQVADLWQKKSVGEDSPLAEWRAAAADAYAADAYAADAAAYAAYVADAAAHASYAYAYAAVAYAADAADAAAAYAAAYAAAREKQYKLMRDELLRLLDGSKEKEGEPTP